MLTWATMLVLPVFAVLLYWRGDYWRNSSIRLTVAILIFVSASLCLVITTAFPSGPGRAGAIQATVYAALAVWVSTRYFRGLRPLGGNRQSFKTLAIQTALIFGSGSIMILSKTVFGVLFGALLLFAALWSRFGLLSYDNSNDD